MAADQPWELFFFNRSVEQTKYLPFISMCFAALMTPKSSRLISSYSKRAIEKCETKIMTLICHVKKYDMIQIKALPIQHKGYYYDYYYFSFFIIHCYP
jgi:hypothetical protein